MLTTTIGEFRKESKQYLDAVYNDSEELIIHRPGGKDVIVISLEEYNSMKETLYLLSTEANRKHLEQSFQEAKEGKVHTVDIKNLWK